MSPRTLLLALIVLPILAGCATTRRISIDTNPPDATLIIDGVDKGRAPLTYEFTWDNDAVIHTVQAQRLGYTDQVEKLARDFDRDTLTINMARFRRRVVINVVPPPAIISVDGRPLSSDPQMSASADLEFNVDARNTWSTHTITAERFGYQPASVTVGHSDRDTTYVLALQHMRKSLSVTTTPPGANVYLDNELKGASPVTIPDVEFYPDGNGTDWEPRSLKVTKPGYKPVEQSISWDSGNTEYDLKFFPNTKTVRFVTDPPGAVVTVDGTILPRNSDGISTANLNFPPVNDQGDLRSYTITVSKKTDADEWIPKTFRLTWDGGQGEYPVGLKEVLTRPVPLLIADIQRGDNGWTIAPKLINTIAMKDVGEGPKMPPPVRITRFPKGTMIDSLALSPDGAQLLLTVISGHDRADFKSQLVLVRTDGTGGADYVSDGKSLDLMPSFSPAGDQVLFASDRFGNRMSLCAMAANGAPGITQLTADSNNALWPSLDSDPTPRLWYETLVDSRADPRIYRTQLNSTLRTDLASGAQPRVSPKNDAILFTQVNEKTSNRDIFRVSDKGGVPENLTDSPDSDQYDAVWSKDGSRIAFVSDRGVTDDNRRNADVWVMDLTHGQLPRQVTHNGSQDDCPVFDPSGNFIFFRSNRGGEWQIWRVGAR